MAGRPVVASRVGALEEVIRDELDGLLVEPDDPAALARAIARILDDRPLREALVESGRQRVAARFTEQAARETWERVVEQALAGGAQNAPRPLTTA
jgi:glycosyltransferase involved in cell wall biosynthesis